MHNPIAFIRIVLICFLYFPLINNAQTPEYPATQKIPVTDTFFNTPVVDEYRWLENLESDNVRQWVERQNSLTNRELKKATLRINSAPAIDRYAYSIYSNPIKQGEYYFSYAYYNNVGAPALFYRKNIHENSTLLVDPNFISSKDDIQLEDYSVSLDSKLLAYLFSRNGSEWGEINVVNIVTGLHREDHLENVRYSNISWKGNGFYYSRVPVLGMGKTAGQEIFYHTLGTSQEEDKLVFKRAGNPEAYFYTFTTSDERFFILRETDEKRGLKNIFYIDFNDSVPALKPLITRLTNDESLNILDNQGGDLIATSFKGSNNGMLVRINPASPRQWKVIIPEFKSALLLSVTILEDQIITVYQSNRKQQIIAFDYQGKTLNAIQIPFGFSVNGLIGSKKDKQLTFSYNGYTQPPVVYVLDVETFKMKALGSTVVNFDYTLYETKELEYKSFDGTSVPLFLIYKKGLNLSSQNPTLLSAYGGFGLIITPDFDPGIVHFLNQGGVFAFANIRGGGDNGKDWALHGRGQYKQNSFGDYIAAAEFLIRNNYTNSNKLGITGGSNGGLVVSAAMVQRPDLFKVAVTIVAPLDMIRLEKFTVGYLNTDEYGSVSDSAGFFNILAYSPLHNIKENQNYPASLIITSENDESVPPFNSYKFAAKMQGRKAQTNPVLLRVEKKSGHSGVQDNFKSGLKSEGEIYDFIMYHLGMY